MYQRLALLGYALLAGIVLYFLAIPIRRARSDRHINQLGSRAPFVQTKWPFGLDFLVWAVNSVRTNGTLNLWRWIFDHTGGAAMNNYTAELRILADARVILTADPENIKAILTTQFESFGKGPQFHKEWHAFLGDSIFTTDKKQWHDSRQMIRPIFTRDRVGDLDVVEEHVQRLMAHLGPGDGRMVELHKLFSRYTLDASTHFLFGRSVRSLDTDVNHFGDAFDDVQRVQATMVRAGPFQIFAPKGKFNRGLKLMNEFVQPYIDEALSLSADELDKKISKSDTFIHSLARYTRDRKLMRDQLFAILLAGRDTTASTLQWIFLELARNPKVVKKLRAEIQDTIGTSGRPPTYQEIKDMKYLNWIIMEVLRLYPIVPFNVRDSNEDTTLPRGGGPDGMSPLGLKSGTSIGYSTLLMQRRRDLYPPISESFPYDPDDWVPERWATWTPKSWQFIPFNGGPRICIGQQFALVEIGYTLIRIFQKYENLVDYGNRPILHAEIVLTPGEGVKVGFCEPNTTEK